jgi:NAD(P)-dependent dehydrogenase (short-subunit alcohol dehydrogenase family)
MKDMTCLVTGASSGLGFAMASGLAGTGATVVMLCRDAERGRKARVELIRQSGNPNIDLLLCDLSSPADVRRFADEFSRFYPRLDVLANIAGTVNPLFEVNTAGLEINLATNILGPFLLTNLLMDSLLQSAPASIVNVSGEAHRTGSIYFDDLQLARSFTLTKSIGQTALARVVWTYELARRLRRTGVTANTFSPGWTYTHIHRHYPALLRWPYDLIARLFARRPQQAMKSIVDFTLERGLRGTTGAYLYRGRPVKSATASYMKTTARRLWVLLEQLADSGTVPQQREAPRPLERP